MSSLLHKMLYALTSAYSRKDYDNVKSGVPVETNIGKLFSIFAWGLDKVQEQAGLIKLWDDLEYAQGRVLDRYGANFGVARGGASDELYRIFIRVKMIAQLSGGDEDTVVKAAAELLGVEYSDIDSDDVWPAKKQLFVDQELLSEERLRLIEQIAQGVKRTMAAGVGLRFYLRTYRTFILPIDVKHGGAIGTAITASDPGMDRAFVNPFDVQRLGFIERHLDAYMPDTEQTATIQAAVARAGFIEKHIDGYMPDATQAAILSAPVAHAGFIERNIGAYMSDAKQAAAMSSVLSHAGFVGTAEIGGLPDVKKAYKRKGSGAGAMYQTHIKAKRID